VELSAAMPELDKHLSSQASLFCDRHRGVDAPEERCHSDSVGVTAGGFKEAERRGWRWEREPPASLVSSSHDGVEEKRASQG
jgi:hypothetical protein